MAWAQLWGPPLGPKFKIVPNKKITPGEVLTHVKNIKNITGKPDMAPKLNPKVIAKILKKRGWAGGCGAGRNFFCLKTLTVILQCTIYNMKTIHWKLWDIETESVIRKPESVNRNPESVNRTFWDCRLNWSWEKGNSTLISEYIRKKHKNILFLKYLPN